MDGPPQNAGPDLPSGSLLTRDPGAASDPSTGTGDKFERPSVGVLAIVMVVAAVVMVVSAISFAQRNPWESGVRPGSPVQNDAGNTSVSQPTGGDEASNAQIPFNVPSTFQTWSLSNAGSGTVYGLGSAECGADICPTLVRSAPDGGSWTAVHTFETTDTSSATGTDIPPIQPDRALSQVRFVDSQSGYVYGGDLWGTADRGASFSKINHAGATVLDLEIWQGEVYLLSADGCVQGRCAGPLYVSSASRGRLQEFTQIDAVAVNGTFDDASIVVKGGLVAVQTTRAGRPEQQPWILSGDKLKPMNAPSACGNNRLQSLTVSASTDAQLFALCRFGATADTYQVLSSRDSGKSWTVVSVTALRLPVIGHLTLAAADKTHLAVSVGGPRGSTTATGTESQRALQVSADGGITWAPAKPPEPPPSNGFDWTASPGGAEFYAVSRTTPGYWASKDFGETWKVIVPTS